MSKLTIATTIKATPQQVFEIYLNEQDNQRWNTTGGGWSAGVVKIDPQVGGRSEVEFKSADGKSDFIFGCVFTEIIPNQKIAYIMSFPGISVRGAEVLFQEVDGQTQVTTIFDAEEINSPEQQKEGWGDILENLKKYVERKVNPNNAVILKTAQFHASAKKVWDGMFEQENYKVWTSAFCEGSYYEGEIKYDQKIKFLSPDLSGLSSVVRVCIPYFQVSFQHLVAINQGVEDYDSLEFAGWQNARETYTFTEENEITTLEIYQEVNTQEDNYFSKMWDKAFVKIRRLVES